MHIMTEDGWQPLSVFCVNSNDLKGVYRPQSAEAARAEADARADVFCRIVETGDIVAIKSFNPPMFGAFGEKL